MLTMLSLMTPLAILPSRLYVHCTAARDDACRCFPDGTGLGATVQSSYDKSTNLTSGFAVLDITTVNKSATPRVVAYAAGLAEGYQTADEIALFFTNVYEFGRDGPSAALTKFVHDNDAWTRQQVADHADESDYWMAVGLVLDRFDGTFAGYKKAQAERPTELPPLTNLDMLWINLDGDLFDLMRAIGDAPHLGRGGRASRLLGGRANNTSNGPVLRCSSLFKRADDGSDVFFSHATWDTYATAAPRIMKHLTLPTVVGGTYRMRTISMSSSPAFMSSIDDYYLIGEAGDSPTTLSVIETSINIDDPKAYAAVTPQSVLCWVRSMVANQIALDAPSWATAFSTHASGTYNNQWMVLNIALANKHVATRAPLPADTFWVLEEVPGLVHAADQTAMLNGVGYWPSFNVIYYDATRKVAGSHGSYKDHMRYRLFAELEPNVTSDAAMRRVIAWNDYQHDKIAKGPSDAIMMRGDLGDYGRASGGIDAKMSSVVLAADGLASYARAGPTNDDQPTFCWTSKFDRTSHAGHPACFDFKWEKFQPKGA